MMLLYKWLFVSHDCGRVARARAAHIRRRWRRRRSECTHIYLYIRHLGAMIRLYGLNAICLIFRRLFLLNLEISDLFCIFFLIERPMIEKMFTCARSTNKCVFVLIIIWFDSILHYFMDYKKYPIISEFINALTQSRMLNCIWWSMALFWPGLISMLSDHTWVRKKKS